MVGVWGKPDLAETRVFRGTRLGSSHLSGERWALMQRWFQESLEPSYQQWLSYVRQPGVRCVDETTYCIDGIKYWLWVATSDSVCALRCCWLLPAVVQNFSSYWGRTLMAFSAVIAHTLTIPRQQQPSKSVWRIWSATWKRW